MRNRLTRTAQVAVLWAALATLASDARAQSGGIQGGFSSRPDQFYAGVHVESPPLRRRITFLPSIHAGAGDRMRALSANLEFVLRPYPNGSTWEAYLGGGPSVNAYWWDEVNRLEQEVGIGGNLVIGIEYESKIFLEFRVGFGNSPHSKIGIGFTFGR